MHERKSTLGKEVVDWAKQFIKELEGIESKNHTFSVVPKLWEPPCDPFVKINFDGAFDLHQAKSACRLVVRNFLGAILASMAICHKRISSPFTTEAQACAQTLRLGI